MQPKAGPWNSPGLALPGCTVPYDTIILCSGTGKSSTLFGPIRSRRPGRRPRCGHIVVRHAIRIHSVQTPLETYVYAACLLCAANLGVVVEAVSGSNQYSHVALIEHMT